MIRAGVITVSDRSSQGIREDRSVPAIAAMLSELGLMVCQSCIVPDEIEPLAAAMARYADEEKLDLVLTTGGTGVSPRDVTPEATLEIIEKEVPGFAEAMRAHSMAVTPFAMISRAVAGIRGRCLIINLPGSPKAARENLAVILPALQHAVAKIKGDDRECGTP